MNSKTIALELREIAVARQDIQEKLIKVQAWQTCLNCLYWTERTTIDGANRTVDHYCTKFDATPPLKIVVIGCPDYEADIPF